jgi:RNA polymerase sigma factor (sigma-70 family)
MDSTATRAGGTGVGSHVPPDKAAVIEDLSRRFRAPLLRYFEKRIGRQAEIEDLLQDVFVRLAGGGEIEAIARVELVEAYLFKTAANLLRDRQRRLAARVADAHESYEEEVHGTAEETVNPERALQSAQLLQQLLAALHEMPERTRVVFTLYHLDELSHAEIARRLGIAISTIEKHVGRAGAYLLKRIERYP